MKSKSKIIRWIFTAIFAFCALTNGFHFSTLFLLSATLLLMPISHVRCFIKDKLKIKNGLAVTLSVILFFVGILNSPISESTEDILDSSSITSVTESATDSEDEAPSLESDSTDNTASENPNSLGSTSPSSSENKVTSSVGTGNATPVNLSSIPEYSGKPYIVLNNNIPNFSASELTQKGYEKYSKLDSLGRTQMAIASVGKDTMPAQNEERGNISSIKPSGWIQAKYTNINGGWLYNRCHLIGWQLSAENANKGNLITGTKYLNVSGMLPFENIVADYIKETGDHVAYRITPIYAGNNLLASGVQMEAYSIGDNGESICFNIYCYNVQPGVKINYATGTSTGPTESTNSITSSVTSSAPIVSSSAPTPSPNSDSVASTEHTAKMVWIPNSGTSKTVKYHSHSDCSGMKNPKQISLEEAKKIDYKPCKRCW